MPPRSQATIASPYWPSAASILPITRYSCANIDKTTASLETMGVDFVAPMQKVTGVGDAEIGVVCFKDPDGTVLELLSGM